MFVDQSEEDLALPKRLAKGEPVQKELRFFDRECDEAIYSSTEPRLVVVPVFTPKD